MFRKESLCTNLAGSHFDGAHNKYLVDISSFLCTVCMMHCVLSSFVHRTSGIEPETGNQKAQSGFMKLLTIQAFAPRNHARNNGMNPKNPIQPARSALPSHGKSAMRTPGGPRRRGKRTVRFKGMVSANYANVIATCVQYTRAGSLGAAWWEAFMAGIVTLDFFCVPLAIVAKAFSSAVKEAKYGKAKQPFNFTFLLLGSDVVFFINIFFNLCQVCCLFPHCHTADMECCIHCTMGRLH